MEGDMIYIGNWTFANRGPWTVIYHDFRIDKIDKFDYRAVSLKGVFAKNERGYRLTAKKWAFDRY